ncbi:MAG: hypothetical protein ACYCY6_02090 [Minisyncoccota bacterium]
MSSPDLLVKQAENWLNSRQNKSRSSSGDVKELEKEMGKLKEQEERYNKAFGAGLITIEQLRDYTTPIRERVGAIEIQISKAKEESAQVGYLGTPSKKDVRAFAKEASKVIHNLSFELKRDIVLNTIDKVVGDQKKLQVYGYIPLSHVIFSSKYRHCGSAKCGEVHPF